MLRISCLCVLLVYSSVNLAANVPLVAVASNMIHTFTEISDRYTHGKRSNINLTFGSSGNFTRQIIQGAPYDLFLSADKKYLDALIENKRHIAISKKFVRGRIGFFIPNSSLFKYNDNLENIVNALRHGDYQRIAIANPEHAPYGLAAKQALQNAGLWAIEKNKLLLGENAAQAMQFTLSGNVDLGIIPSSFAMLNKISQQGKFYLIPEHWHHPLQQYLILLNGASKEAQQFYNYLVSDEPKQILENHGYTIGSNEL